MIIDALLATVMAASAALPSADDDYWYSVWGPLLLSSDVSPDSALQTTAVMACVKKRVETFATLPFHVYRRGGPAWPGSKRQARYRAMDHPLEELLNYQANRWQTASEFREMMEGHVCLRGNAYAVIVPGRRGAITELIPKHPDRMEVFRLENGKLGYLYRPLRGPAERYTQDQIFHLRNLSFDGLAGVGPIALQRRAVELAQQAEKHGAQYYKAGKPSGVLQMPEGRFLKDEEHHRQMRQTWRDAHSDEGLFSVAVLEDGMTWQQTGLSAEDMQYLESRRYQVVEICRIFDVPPHLIWSAIEHGLKYENIEHTDLFYVKYCLMSWARRWEQAIRRDLLVDQETYYPRFSLEGLLRADTATRGQWYERMIGLSVFCPNDVLELEDRNPHRDGEQYYIQSSLLPAASVVSAGGVVVPPETEQLAEAAFTEYALGPQYDTSTMIAMASVAEDEHDAAMAWASDIANRLASAEQRGLMKHVDKAAEAPDQFVEWLKGQWLPRHRAYVETTVGPFAIAMEYDEAEAIISKLLDGAIALVTSSTPPSVCDDWATRRAAQIVRVLLREEQDDGR